MIVTQVCSSGKHNSCRTWVYVFSRPDPRTIVNAIVVEVLDTIFTCEVVWPAPHRPSASLEHNDMADSACRNFEHLVSATSKFVELLLLDGRLFPILHT